MRFIFAIALILAPLSALSQPFVPGGGGGGGGGATQLTDLTDVTAKSGNSTVVVMGSGPFTSGDCVEFDASGNAVASGGPCAGTGDVTAVGDCTTGACFDGTTGTTLTGVGGLTLNPGGIGGVTIGAGGSPYLMTLGANSIRWSPSNFAIYDGQYKDYMTANNESREICGGINNLQASGACIGTFGSTHATEAGDVPIVLGSNAGAQFTVTDNAAIIQLSCDENGCSIVDSAYGIGWDGSTLLATRNAIYDELETKTDTGHSHVETDITDLAHDGNAGTICAGTTTYLDGEGTCDDISSVYAATAHTHVEANITDLAHTTDAADLTSGVLANARVQQSNVTQHQSALTITESQISDLAHTTDTTCSTVACTVGTDDTVTMEQGTAPGQTAEGRLQWDTDDNRLVVGNGVTVTTFYSGPHTTDTNASTICSGDTTYLDGNGGCDDISSVYAATSHTHAAADTISGTFADARISQSSVTQHQAALSITESQISDLVHTTDTTCSTAACSVGTDDTVTMEQGTAPAVTTEGRLQWDTDDDRIVVGDGITTQTFYSGPHTIDTGPSPDCAGTLTYQDGEGGCDTYTLSGSTTELGTISGAKTNGNCVEFDASGNLVDSGGTCGGGPIVGDPENLHVDVTQTAHGFAVLDAIYHNGTSWLAARSDASTTLGTHIVTEVADANNFTAGSHGRFTATAHGLTVGQTYFVDGTTAGDITATEPTTGFSNPILYAEDANTIQVREWRASDLSVLAIGGLSDVDASYTDTWTLNAGWSTGGTPPTGVSVLEQWYWKAGKLVNGCVSVSWNHTSSTLASDDSMTFDPPVAPQTNTDSVHIGNGTHTRTTTDWSNVTVVHIGSEAFFRVYLGETANSWGNSGTDYTRVCFTYRAA